MELNPECNCHLIERTGKGKGHIKVWMSGLASTHLTIIPHPFN